MSAFRYKFLDKESGSWRFIPKEQEDVFFEAIKQAHWIGKRCGNRNSKWRRSRVH